MKSLRLLVLPFCGFMLFVSALLLPPPGITMRDILMIFAALPALLFYFITLARVIKTFSWYSSKKIFWLTGNNDHTEYGRKPYCTNLYL